MTPFDITGRNVLVTGGTRGLGRAISLHLATCGANVVAGYFQDEQAAEEFRSIAKRRSLPIATVKANLMTTSGISLLHDSVAAMADGLHALIYNAATGVHRPLDALTQRHLATVWQVNVGAFFDLAQKVKPLMGTGSRIVAISSEGSVRAVDGYGAVGASKAALEALCRQMAAEWASDGIGVNAVAPGLLETDTLRALEQPEARMADEIANSPLGRLVTPDEVAQFVHFLCSRASEGIVGQTIVIDGGKRVSALTS